MNQIEMIVAKEIYQLALKKAVYEGNEELKKLFEMNKIPFNEIAKLYKGKIKYEFLLEAKRRYFPSQYLYTLNEIQQLANYAQDKDFIEEIAFEVYIKNKKADLLPKNVLNYIEVKYGKKIVNNPAHLSRLLLKHELINKEYPTIYGYWQEYEDDCGKWKGRWRFTVETIEWIKNNLLASE